MIEAIATVVGIQNGCVSVEYKRTSACGHCHHQSSCSMSVGEEMQNNAQVIDIECNLPLSAGQQVRIGIPEKSLLKGALLVYILPLVFILLGAAIGQMLSDGAAELPAIMGALSGGIIGFMLMRLWSAKLTDGGYKPVILGVTIPVSHVL